MGGKALNRFGVETIRKTTKEFLKLANYFQNKLGNDLGVETHIVKFFRKKETHGDLDVLIKADRQLNLKEYVQETFNPTAINNNGGVLSFDYDDFQIDFIPTKPATWEVAKTFFDWDPSGNLMGKTAHKFGAKYGFDGLTLPVRGFSGRIVKTINLCKDNRKIFQFLGYDYDRYLKGFDTKEEIFDWVIDSKYFDSEMFEMQNLNQIDRKRNKKRVTYQDFLQYLKIKGIKKSFNFKDKEEYIETINEFFPEVGLKEELEELKRKDEENKAISNKFNGHVIMNRYEWLQGKELGEKMRDFKNRFKNFGEYILNNDEDKIMKDFDNYLKTNK